MSKDTKKILGFKIRNPKTGLYLSSLSADKWTKIGKVWPRRCDAFRAINCSLKAMNRMKSFNGNRAEAVLERCLDWEIVELTEESSCSLVYYVNKIKI